MNGPQDMGGMMGFGPIAPEVNEPLFHAPWERRALAISLAMGGTRQWNIDMSRHAREKIPPAQYWSLSYYEIWMEGLKRLLTERGLLDAAFQKTCRSLKPQTWRPLWPRAVPTFGQQKQNRFSKSATA